MSSSDAGGAAAVLGSIGCIGGLIGLAMGVLMIIAFWKIFAKAGFSGALALLLLIPLANLIIILYLAFSQWPIHDELNRLRAAVMPRGPQYPSYPQGQQYPQGPQY